jgi:hypothetical protein
MVSQESQGEYIRENVVENLYTVLDKLNNFLKINLFPAVLGLLKYCFVVFIVFESYMFWLKNDCLVTIRNLLLSKFTF